MHSSGILSKFLEDVCPLMHASRREALFSILSSCLTHERVGVTSLGRGISGNSLEKHRIKRADRLLSNAHLDAEREGIYSALSERVLRGLSQAVILIDWSNLDRSARHFLLRASVAVEGRSITVYEEIHTNATKEKLKTHKQFLKNLKRTLPSDIVPIIVTDAGFRITWFKAVERLGWHWVGRVRGRMKVKQFSQSSWIEGRALAPQRIGKAYNFDEALIGKRNNLECRLVLYKEKPKGRVMLGKFGKRRTWITATRSERAHHEPLLLTTSLTTQHYAAQKIVAMYQSRMQIEESFRDMKCSKYGIGLIEARTYKTNRMRTLVLIATLANTFAWLLGKAAEIQNVQRHFQANSITQKRVLSTVFLGMKVFKQNRLMILYDNFKNAWQEPIKINCKQCVT